MSQWESRTPGTLKYLRNHVKGVEYQWSKALERCQEVEKGGSPERLLRAQLNLDLQHRKWSQLDISGTIHLKGGRQHNLSAEEKMWYRELAAGQSWSSSDAAAAATVAAAVAAASAHEIRCHDEHCKAENEKEDEEVHFFLKSKATTTRDIDTRRRRKRRRRATTTRNIDTRRR